jgi:hypothetical protein
MASATLAFWNVRNLFPAATVARGPQTPAELGAKLAVLVRVIGRLATGGRMPDLLALAEIADASLVSSIVAGLGVSGASFIFEAPHGAGQTGIAVLALTRRVAGLSHVDVDWGVFGQVAGRPRALSVDATVVVRGRAEVLRVVACHWKSDRPGAYPPARDREGSGRWLERHVDGVASVVAVGDLNAEPFAREIVDGLRACRHYSTTTRGRLYNAVWPWLAEPDHHAATAQAGYRVSRPRTTIAEGYARILDQVLVSRAVLRGEPFRLDQASIRYHLDQDSADWVSTGNVAPRSSTSDHFPLVFELTW